MVSHDDAKLHAAVERLRDCDSLEVDDALILAEVSIRSLGTLMDSGDPSTEGKLDTMAGKVGRLKSEISHLQANHLKDRQIPEAGSELEATREATETAATRIMEAAEAIMDADPENSQAYVETVNASVMEIFEACAFQDITGQRISKVQENLDSIKKRVNRLAEAVGATDSEEPLCAEEAEREARKKKLILNGPARDGEGRSQDEVDAMFP
ncbi:MAG: protein phosphatase CheZ [Hyphomicrobiales bacterium]|nr:protein phosphatase CheZ [Hyphomicrobiales bacterium]